jgi:hypothetical protein
VKQLVLVLGVVLSAMLLVAAPASADTTPWSQGVPEATQDKAIAVFEEGNTLFAQQAHAPALEKYRAAVALWDHPLIRFNIAVTLIRLDRVLDAADELERALRYGESPFKKDLYSQALDYQALLKGRVGYVEAKCEQDGASVLLDGKPWFSCPGTQKIRVMAGEHALVGELSHYLTSSQRIVVVGGTTVTETVKLVPLESAVILKYPYRRWIPYTVTVAGLAVGLGGLGVWLLGRDQMTDFENEFADKCAMGCQKDLSDNTLLRDVRDSAELKGTIGITMMVTGGAVAVGGIVMTVLNRPQRILPKVEVAPTNGGMTMSTSFTF